MDSNEDSGIDNSSDNIWASELEPFELECVDELQSGPNLVERLIDYQNQYEQQIFRNFQASAIAIAQLYRDRHHPVWLPFQSAALAVTNMYKECVKRVHNGLELGQQTGRYTRTKELVSWLQKRKRRTVQREEILAFLCGKSMPARGGRKQRHSVSLDRSQMRPLHSCAHNQVSERNALFSFPHSVASPDVEDADDLVQFQNALDQGAVGEVPVNMGYRSHNSSTRQDLQQFIKEEAYKHTDLRKRPAQIQEFDPAARKRSRLL